MSFPDYTKIPQNDNVVESEFIPAAKKVNGVTVGYVVGWRHNGGGFSNIRAGLMFETPEQAIEFWHTIQNNRFSPFTEFHSLLKESRFKF